MHPLPRLSRTWTVLWVVRRLRGALFAVLSLATLPAAAQDASLLLVRLALLQPNAAVLALQPPVRDAMAQRMRDPAHRAAWQRHVDAHGGRPGMDYASFTLQTLAASPARRPVQTAAR